MIVCKFGGTSMATAKSILQVAAIVQADNQRKVCVVSGPGKTADHEKVTDRLLVGAINEVYLRFAELMNELSLGAEAHHHLETEFRLRAASNHVPTRVSFGEHMSAYILARLLTWRFVDATSVIHFVGDAVEVSLPEGDSPVVIPGYYGWDGDVEAIRLFPRGGSDISAAYIAAAYGALYYENWTDVSGVYPHDPRVVSGQLPFGQLTYDELTSLANSGAQVFHPEAILPVVQKGIPTIIRNTFAPDDVGTTVVPSSV